MAVDRKQANLEKLKEADEIQAKTKEAIWRIQRQAAEAEGLGTQTLEELRRQGEQMDDIHTELESVSQKLDQSQALQSKFDRWAGNWLGGKKAKAMKEAAAEIALRNQEEHSKIKEVFQQEKYDKLARKWRKHSLVLCTDPTLECNDLFDPAIQETIENSQWSVDFTLVGIDAEGWTYAYDFATLNKTGAGDPAPKWNSYVRRRKWRMTDRSSSGSAALNEVKDRNEARKAKAAANAQAANGTANGSSKAADKIGYVPRNKQASTLTASGLTSTGMTRGGKDQELDDVSAAGLARLKEQDAEIDAGIDAISKTIDNLGNIANTMKEETQMQNKKLNKIDEKMSTTTEKQTVVNARQRFLLKSS